MNINTWIDKLYKAAENSNADEFQIIYDYEQHESWKLLQGKISTKETAEDQKVSVMLKKDGKIGRCVSYNLSEDAIKTIIDSALENAKLIDKTEENFFYDGKGVYAHVDPYHPISDKITTLNPIEFMKEVEKEVIKADRRILPNPQISFGKAEQKKIIRNSLGVNLHRENEEACCSLFVIAKDNNDVKSRFERIVFDKDEDFNSANIAQKAVKKAISQLHGIKPKSGPTKVVFAPEGFISILYYLGYCTSAETIEKRQSQLAGKLGKQIASPLLTVIEDPLQKGGYNTAAFNDEGVPTYKKEIITKGILQTYLYNLKTAHKAGVKPTGNEDGRGFGVTLRNLYIEKGNVTKEELLEKVGDGIYVNNERGFLQGIMTSSSGDFSFSAKGFLIENGQISQPLEQFTVAGNYYQMLKDIKLIANDLEFVPYGISSPTIWVDGLIIGGK